MGRTRRHGAPVASILLRCRAIALRGIRNGQPAPKPAPRAYALRFVAGAHFLRTLGLALGFLAVAAVLHQNGASRPIGVLLVLHGFAWAHIARALAQRNEDPVWAERRNVLVDSLLCGMWIALMGFNTLPSVL